MIVISRTTGHKAKVNDHPRGVTVELYERDTAPGAPYRRLGVYLSEKPMHAVLDCVHDMMRAL